MNTRRPFLVALALLSASLALVTGCGKRPQTAPDAGLLKVTVATPKVDSVALFTDLTGSVAAPQAVQVRPRVSGFIKEVLFKEGDRVIGSVHLFGREIYAGDPLFQIDPVTYEADLQSALAQVSVSQAKLKLAKANEDRAKLSFEKGVSSKQEYDTYTAQTEVAKAELEASQGPVIKARQNMGWTVVRAFITGKIGRAELTRGNVVTGGETQGTVLTSIVSVDPMYVYFDVDDQTAAFYQRMFREGKLKPVDQGGTPQVDIKLLGDEQYNRSGPDEYTRHGHIDFAGNQLNPTTGTISIRGVFANEDRMLIPNRYVKGRIPLGGPVQSLLVPDAAVVTEQSKKLVYVVGADNKVASKTVTLGPQSRGLRLVQSGLTKDDRVIVRGVQRVQPGEAVEPEQGTIDYPARP